MEPGPRDAVRFRKHRPRTIVSGLGLGMLARELQHIAEILVKPGVLACREIRARVQVRLDLRYRRLV